MIDGNGAVAEVGTLLKIEQHKRLPDGQMVVMSRGEPYIQLASLTTALHGMSMSRLCIWHAPLCMCPSACAPLHVPLCMCPHKQHTPAYPVQRSVIQTHTAASASHRLGVVAAGIERYRLRKVIQKQPILIADVELFPAEEDTSQEVRDLQTRMSCLGQGCLAGVHVNPGAWHPSTSLVAVFQTVQSLKTYQCPDSTVPASNSLHSVLLVFHGP